MGIICIKYGIISVLIRYNLAKKIFIAQNPLVLGLKTTKKYK